MRHIRLPAVCLVLSVASPGSAQRGPLTVEEKREAYVVYSTVLKTKEPKVDSWVIADETRHFELCTRATAGQESVYRPLFGDYASRNRQPAHLDGNFFLPRFSMAPILGWGATRGQSNFVVFSRVGFNTDFTRAAVCFWAGTSGTCSVLVKKDRRWEKDSEFRGDGCGWAN